MSPPFCPTPLDRLRQRYQTHLASTRDRAVVDPEEDRGPEGKQGGRREGSVAGKETRRGLRRGATWAGLTQAGWDAFSEAWAQRPETVWVWSDHHLGHANILRYAHRPFGDLHYMHAQMLARAQAAVDPEDWLLFVGDLALWGDRALVETWMVGCPGHKVLVLGNHDVRGKECPRRVEDWLALGFEAVADVAWLPAADRAPELWITHYPLARSLVPAGVVNVHGHIHAQHLDGPYVNACVEQIEYRPQRLTDLVSNTQI